MSEAEGESTKKSATRIPRFHGRRGEDYGLWRLRLRAACRVNGIWNVVETMSSVSSSSGSATEILQAEKLR